MNEKLEDSTAFAVCSRTVSPKFITTVGVLFWEGFTPPQCQAILAFNERVKGHIVITLNRSGAIAVKWLLHLRTPAQARVAAKVLADIVSMVVGVSSIHCELRNDSEVLRALAA